MAVLAELIGDSPGILAVQRTVERLLVHAREGRRLPPVLLQGETGTGKGLLARALHRGGPRAGGPFVDVNCAAIPEALLEAELFGYERGAFTDARQGKAGLFQAAHRGTLFLDEVGLLPEALQGKLLTVLEAGAVRRLGAVRAEPVDVWVVAATNADLARATRERRFREDLYHRLAVVEVRLPPLRERGEDIARLAEHFLVRACADYGLGPRTFAPAARAALLAYPWPGNVRELLNVMERVALLEEGREVTAAMLGLPAAPPVGAAEAPQAAEPVALNDAVESVERAHLLEALRATNWNISHAAVRLGVPRNTLRYRIEKYGLRPAGAAPPRRAPRLTRTAEPVAGVAAPAPPSLQVDSPPAAAVPVPVGIRWERRSVTLLRAALVAPVAPTATLDVGRIPEILVEKVRGFGGRIEELGPTAITAAFGLEPAEDAPRRAALAAIAIQKAAERGWGRDAPGITVRAAIHTGDLMLGRVNDATMIDQEAKREAWTVLDALLERATPGTVLVSGVAGSVLRRRFDLLPVGPAAERRGGVYRVVGPEQAGLGFGGRPARFVGRQRDLELLESRLAATLAGQGQVVGVVGEAGIGKSRLLFEFRQRLAGQRVTYLEGHCVSYGSAIPYLPVADILRENCGIIESDSPGVIAEKLRAGLVEVEIAPGESAPLLLHLLGVKEGTERLESLTPEAIKARTLDILRQMCLKGSRRRAIIFVVEDLHWVDTASEEFFASLVESLIGVPMLLLVTYRPGYRPPWLAKSYATQIALGPLSPDESLAVLESVLPERPLAEAVARLFLDRAEGNPFFLEELARAVAEQGEASGLPSIPDTIQEVLLARIDRLDAEPKRLLQRASVLGREFSLRLLRAIWDGPEALETPLREVVRQEFLYEQAGLEEAVYVFKHALIQEVARSSLLEPQRRQHHAAAGRALEQLYAGRTDEVVELLAHHFGLSDEAEKAVDYAILAAEKAQRRWANTEALAHFDAALRRLDAMPDTAANRLRRIDAVLKQAEVKFALGQHAEHIQALEGIRDLVETAADPRRRAAWYCWTGFLSSLTGGRLDVAIAYCRQASTIAETGAFEEIRALADCCLAHVSVLAGDFRNALVAGERALTAFEARGNVWWACRTLWALSPAATSVGEWERALAYCRRAQAHGEAVDDLRLKIVGWWRTGSTHVQRGDPAAGLPCFEEALALSPSPFDAAMVRAAQGYGLIKAGEVAAGTAQLAESVAWFDRSHLRYTRSTWALRLAEGYLRQRERSRAREVLEEVLATSREFGYRYLEGAAGRLLGEVLGPDDPAAAATRLEAAVQILGDMGARDEAAKAWVAQASLRRAAGDRAGARQLLERALAVFESLGTLDEPPRVRAVLAALGSHDAV